ncbi:hypothetical protein [Acetobacter orientalis]|uniref:Uncharacterized protein n=2 Tax=Acetobacter orientalis TaxID=146474 RepID=A0A0D6NJW4_9PROT|nr:hypothetical protein [Acetobacter orientalis]GAN65691.1 hypothetical protein Abor_012_030 [Acetobacter orientalis]GBR14147.1 hypothetical protein AA0481_0536 [Acetobacter orientalis NRIC 0481]GEL60818.1 hypothetical protein AOR02nite_06600 [Acetobacter orientalis]
MTDAQSAELMALVVPRLDDHNQRIAALESGQATLEAGQVRLEQSVTTLTTKMAEYNGENRSRAEAQKQTFEDGINALGASLDGLAKRIDRLGSVRGWAGWAIVTSASAGVATLVSHFWMHP